MSRTITMATLAAAAPMLIAACAVVPSAPQEGTVAAVFVEPLPGILLSPDLAESGVRLPRWAEVRFDPSVPGTGRTLARLPDDTDIDVGDRVAVQPASAVSALDLPLPGVPGMKAARPVARDAQPAMVTALHWRAPRVEVTLP